MAVIEPTAVDEADHRVPHDVGENSVAQTLAGSHEDAKIFAIRPHRD
jgi:hypothetical protein